MKKKNSIKLKRPLKQSYLSLVSVILMGLCLIILNLSINTLPKSWLIKDVSDNHVTELSNQAKAVLQHIDTEVEIVVLQEDANVDQRIRLFLENIKKQNDLITVSYLDPVYNPSATKQYNAYENTIVVKNKETSAQEVIYLDDIIVYDSYAYYYYESYVETEFDGEGQIVAAIQHVLSDTSHKIYITVGHDELTLDSTILESIEKSGFTIEEVNLLLEGSVPSDCEMLVLYAPVSDLAEDELTMLQEYLEYGDAFVVLSSELMNKEEQPNLSALLEEYNLIVEDGYAADMERYYQNNAYFFFAEYENHSITSGLNQDEDLTLIAYSRGLTVSDEHDDVETEIFMTTSNNALMVSEDTEKSGQFVLGATAIKTWEENMGQLTVIASDTLVSEDLIGRFSNLANSTIFTNAIMGNFEDAVNVSFASKSLEVSYNTVMNPGFYSLIFIAFIPLGLLIWGFIIWVKRRRAI